MNIPAPMRPVTVLRPGSLTETMTEWSDWADLVLYCIWMESAKLSVRTITDRLAILRRLQRFLEQREARSTHHSGELPDSLPQSPGPSASRSLHPAGDLTQATRADLEAFQASYRHLQVASVNVYTRHVKAFYGWLTERGAIAVDPSRGLLVPTVHRGQPHPATVEQVRVIFACSTGPLRLAYALAAFAGLRCGEITRLQSNAVDLASPIKTAIVHGKGGRQRTVPVLPPLAVELGQCEFRRGWVVRRDDGAPYSPRQLSNDSCRHMQNIGVDTTLHSLRHSFATWAARTTRDPLLVRDLLGHASVATTEIYMASAAVEAQSRLTELSALAGDVLGSARLAHSA